jgi:hypothetical protein
MENKAKPTTNTNGHTQATLDIMDNAVAAGKVTQDEADNLLDIASNDPDVVKTLKDIVRRKKIKPELIDGKYHQTLIKQAATKSWDEIHQHVGGGISSMQKSAPELYKAKHFEKYGRLPAKMMG